MRVIKLHGTKRMGGGGGTLTIPIFSLGLVGDGSGHSEGHQLLPSAGAGELLGLVPYSTQQLNFIHA